MRRGRWLTRAGSVTLATVLVGCGTVSCSSAPDPAPSCPTGTPPFSLRADSYAGVGKPGDAKGTSRPFVVVLDEKHNSRVGQVEIAIMLTRLYGKAKLRHLGLEGSVVEDRAPDLAWFRALPDVRTRRAVALRMLEQGEVSAAEFAAMVLPGFQVHPIESRREYQVDLSDAASRSYTAYLVAIALTTMTPDQQAQANTLLDQNRYDEAIDFMVGTSPWTKDRYAILKRSEDVVTTEQMRQLGSELDQKAEEVGAEVADYRDDFREAREFYDTAAHRSTTMVAKIGDVAKARAGDCAPVAMDIGAAHTDEVTHLLERRKTSYAVVSPSSLSAGSENGNLPAEAYDRKLNSRSVDPAGGLGALLDGRPDGQRKPPPVVQTEWFKAKAELSYATVVIARAAGGGAKPPFDLNQKALGLGGSGPDAPRITIDLSTIEVVPVPGTTRRDVIFEVTLGNKVTQWIRAGVVAKPGDPRDSDSDTLEQALQKVRDELEAEPPGEDPPAERNGTEPPRVVSVTGDVKAAVAKSREALEPVHLV